MQFERLSNKLPGLFEAFHVGTFVSGLHEEIRYKVKRDHPNSMTDAICRALAMEEEFQYFHSKTTLAEGGTDPSTPFFTPPVTSRGAESAKPTFPSVVAGLPV